LFDFSEENLLIAYFLFNNEFVNASHFHLPAAFIELGNGAGCPLGVMGDEFNLLLVYFIPNNYPPE